MPCAWSGRIRTAGPADLQKTLGKSPCQAGGEAGIRTLGTGFSPYNGLANRRFRPLSHLTADRKYTARKQLLDRAFLGLLTTVFQTAAFAEFGLEIRISLR